MAEVLTRAGGFVAIIFLGFLLKKVGLFKKEDFSVLSKIMLKVTLPAAIVSSFANRELDPSLLIIVLLGLGCGVGYMLLSVVVNLRTGRDQMAFDILNLTGYNIGNFTMPFVQSFLAPMGMIATSIFDVGNSLVCLGVSLAIAISVKSGAKLSFKRIFSALAKSVPFLVYVIMLVLNLLHIKLPAAITDFAGVVGGANPFIAMFAVGLGFHFEVNLSQFGKLFRTLALRYGFAVVAGLIFWFVLPFQLEIRQALLILVFSPIGAAVPPFTAELGGDVGLSSAVNSASIVISTVMTVVLLSVIL